MKLRGHCSKEIGQHSKCLIALDEILPLDLRNWKLASSLLRAVVSNNNKSANHKYGFWNEEKDIFFLTDASFVGDTLYTKKDKENTPIIHHSIFILTTVKKNTETIKTNQRTYLTNLVNGNIISDNKTNMVIKPKNTARSFKEPTNETDLSFNT